MATGDEIYAIHETVDDLLLDGNFAEVQRLVDRYAAYAANIDTDLLLAMLTITHAARHKLPGRAALYREIERVITERGEMESGLLDGLE